VSGIEVTFDKLTAALHARYGRSIAELHQEIAELTAVNETLMAERDRRPAAAKPAAPLVYRPDPDLSQNIPAYPADLSQNALIRDTYGHGGGDALMAGQQRHSGPADEPIPDASSTPETRRLPEGVDWPIQ
jgi:hypothetical protein